ncbi:2Fe-2S iron-sulfur cluster-binding protein [Lacipirellula sp.]|uniref:2Fe-2S iron-sulfur cluster-binding protein n=1 Tax=Lacipirellula sp. TaxID=2691419 RepID=UPI003D0C4D79
MLEPASLGLISGAALLGTAGVRAVRGVRGLLRREQERVEKTERERAAFANQLDAALHWARASQPRLKAWIGVRDFRVSAVVDEAEGCRSFYLVPEDGRPLARFEPGQYLTFHLPTADAMRPLVRCYSLSDRPRDDYYRITVKCVPRPVDEGQGGGRETLSGSNYFHRDVNVGSTLAIEAPQGSFFLDPTDDLPVVLIGGGIGVTPILSMAAALVHRRDRRQIYAFTGFRNSGEHPFKASFEELATATSNLTLDVAYSRPYDCDRPEVDYSHWGHVNVDRLRQVLPSNNFRYYLCGPPGMMESLVPALLEWGVPAEHINYEAFGPATVRGLSDAAASEPCNVDFVRSEKSLRWQGNEESLLNLAEQGGVRLEWGCRAGNCGQCRVMIAAGRVAHAKRPGVELVDGECLACIARPVGDVVVEA